MSPSLLMGYKHAASSSTITDRAPVFGEGLSPGISPPPPHLCRAASIPQGLGMCWETPRLSRSQSPIAALWLGPAEMHLSCKDMMLLLANSLQLAPYMHHRSPNPSQSEESEHIHPHLLHGVFNPRQPARRKLPLFFHSQSVGSGHGATEVLSHKHLSAGHEVHHHCEIQGIN